MDQVIKIPENLQKYIQNDANRSWVLHGLFYGYPSCCIINFCERHGKMNKIQKEVHKNYGFIPCPDCAEKIASGAQSLSGILENRIYKTSLEDDINF